MRVANFSPNRNFVLLPFQTFILASISRLYNILKPCILFSSFSKDNKQPRLLARLQLAACHCCLHCKSGVLQFCFLSRKYTKVLVMFKNTTVTLMSRSCPNCQQLFCTRIRRMSGTNITFFAIAVTEHIASSRTKDSKQDSNHSTMVICWSHRQLGSNRNLGWQ